MLGKVAGRFSASVVEWTNASAFFARVCGGADDRRLQANLALPLRFVPAKRLPALLFSKHFAEYSVNLNCKTTNMVSIYSQLRLIHLAFVFTCSCILGFPFIFSFPKSQCR